MKGRTMMVALLAMLMLATATAPVVRDTAQGATRFQLVWYGFLYGIPVMLSGLLLAGYRWALMAGVMYGTIGLALDIATLVQDVTGPAPQPAGLALSGATGLINLLLIVLGGREFLRVEPAPTPPGGRPPSPRPPPST